MTQTYKLTSYIIPGKPVTYVCDIITFQDGLIKLSGSIQYFETIQDSQNIDRYLYTNANPESDIKDLEFIYLPVNNTVILKYT